MATIRLQKPLILNGNNIYPLTTYDQIIMPDGKKWNGIITGGGVDVVIEPIITSGTKLATISVNGVSKDLYYQASAVTLNNMATTSPSFYAPTTAGTNGQVLKSNGSGAPTWITLGSNAYTSTAYLPISGGTVTSDLKAQGQLQSQSTSTCQYPGLWFRNDENADIGAVYMKPSSNNNLNIRWKRDDGGGDGFYYITCKAADGSVTATKFVGSLQGNASTATTLSSTLAVNKGGTGATEASAARTNLGLERSKIYYTIDLSSYSTNNFYFIDFGVSDFELDCEIHSNNVGSDSAYNQNHIHFLMTDNGWSDTVKTFTVLSQGSYSHTELTIMSIYAGTQNGLRGVYVRGGLIYRIFSNTKPTLNTTTKTNGAESYTSGTTSYTNVTNATQVWVNDGQAKASWSVPLYGAVWNDYAEYRSQNEIIEPGYITYCDDDGKLKKTVERLQKFEGVVSDTFGFAIGETDNCKTPLAVSGRALVYCDPEEHFHAGDAVCAGPDGLAYRMKRNEIIAFPDRVVGIVSEIPTYETWGTGNVKVNGRIWVKVK